MLKVITAKKIAYGLKGNRKLKTKELRLPFNFLNKLSPDYGAFLLPDFYIVHPQMVNGLGVKLVLMRLVVPVVFRLCSQSQA